MVFLYKKRVVYVRSANVLHFNEMKGDIDNHTESALC